MDPTTLANNPLFKKLGRLIFVFALFEIAIFVLASYFFGFGTILIITLGFTILGYSIKPFNNPFDPETNKPKSPFENFRSVRKLAGTLFMIPGFLTDIAAIFVLIPPCRNFATFLGKKIAKRKLDKLGLGGIDPSLFSNLGNMAGGGFPGMNPDMFKNAAASSDSSASNNKTDSAKPKTHSEQRKAKRERHKQVQTVDVDYEVRDGDGVWIGGKAESPTDIQVKMKHDAPPKVLEPEVIDVDGEWK